MHISKIDPFGLFRNFVDIFKIIKKVKPNLIHAVTIKPVIIGGILSRVCNEIPFVAAISGLGYLFTSKKLKSKIFKKYCDFFL